MIETFKEWIEIQRILNAKRTLLYGVLIIAAILALTLIVRGCSNGMLDKKIFVIARDNSWALTNLYGKEHNMSAFTDELLKEIAKRQNIRFETVAVTTNALFEGLNNEMYDGVLSTISPNTSTNEKYLFSHPFYLLGPVLVVKANSPTQSLQQMAGKVIGIQNGSIVALSLAQYPSILIISYDNVGKAMVDLENNALDGAIVNANQAYAFTHGPYAGRLIIASAPLTDDGIRLITLRNPQSELLLQYFNEGLKSMQADGTYEALLKKWDLSVIGPDST